MKSMALSLAIVGVILLGAFFAAGGSQPVKPEPQVAEDTPSPDYHKPLDQWRVEHPEKVEEIGRMQCLMCHDPSEHCEVCHRYVGVNPEVVP